MLQAPSVDADALETAAGCKALPAAAGERVATPSGSAAGVKAASDASTADQGVVDRQEPGSAGGSQGGASTADGTSAAPPDADPASPDSGEALRVTIDAKERLRWSPQLHDHFCKAVAQLGGSAYAKPKDIVARMGVPGLTLAHVKSHLQKYRQQEGVTFVPHSTRNTLAATRRFQQQQARRPAPSSGSDSDGSPAAKRTRAASPPSPLQPQPLLPPAPSLGDSACTAQAAMTTVVQAVRSPCAAADSSVDEPFHRYVAALASPASRPPPPPLPLPLPLPAEGEAAAAPPAAALAPAAAAPAVAAACEQPGETEAEAGLRRLRALAELAAEQHDELAAQRAEVAAAAAAAGPPAERLAALPAQPGWAATAPPALRARLDALLRHHVRLSAAAAAHAARGAVLARELHGFQAAAQELLLHAEGAAAEAAAPASVLAAATAALRTVAEQHGAGADAAGAAPMLAAQLLGAMAAAAQQAPVLAPAQQASAAGLSQLQQLFHRAALLAASHA